MPDTFAIDCRKVCSCLVYFDCGCYLDDHHDFGLADSVGLGCGLDCLGSDFCFGWGCNNCFAESRKNHCDFFVPVVACLAPVDFVSLRKTQTSVGAVRGETSWDVVVPYPGAGAGVVETTVAVHFVYFGLGPPGLKKTDCLGALVKIYSHALFPLDDLPGQSNPRFQGPAVAECSIGRDKEAGLVADTLLAADRKGRVPALLLRHPLAYGRADLARLFWIG